MIYSFSVIMIGFQIEKKKNLPIFHLQQSGEWLIFIYLDK